jgi:uncharacterized protein (DUF2141 family)
MFVLLKKTLLIGTAFTLMACSSTLATGGQNAQAAPAGTLTVHLKDVQAGGGPLYVSVQKREDFKQDRGTTGGIYKDVSAGDVSYTYTDVPLGEYSVMIWHDIDNDGVFTMDEKNYMPLDGWGASGSQLHGDPAFDDVKINVTSSGKTVDIQMFYIK